MAADFVNTAADGCFDPDSIPPELRAIDRWVAYRSTPPKKDGDKRGKVPVDPKSGKNASSTDPGTWASFDRALLRMQADVLAGVGFVFNGDGICGIDLDKCRDPVTGVIDPWAREIVAELNSYTEISPSGTGLHIYVRAKLPPGRRRKGIVEMYDTGRFFTVTGWRVEGTPSSIEDRQPQVDALHARTFTSEGKPKAKKAKPTSDERILERARTAKNGEKFTRLWGGDISGYKSESEADLALCAILSFWARGDAETVDRLFRQSKLMRPKWDEMHGAATYGATTVAIACQPRDGRTTRIDVFPGELPEQVEAAQDLLLALTPPRVFQRERLLYRIIRLDETEVTHGTERPRGSLGLHLVDDEYVLLVLAREAEWYGWKRGELVRIDPPKAVAQTLLAAVGWWKFPTLVGFIEAPTLRRDGSILDQAGYDPTSKLYLDTGGVDFESVPQNPTREDALAALEVLRAPFAKFPFVAQSDLATLLAAILTALVRRSLPSAPIFLFDARTMGTGKTLLADSVSLIATGRTCALMTQGHDATEDQKRMLAILLNGDLVACIDNIDRPLEGADLCVVATERTYQGRVLGISKTAKVPCKTLWLATGNNILVRGDLVTRVLACDLDAQCERPEQREFEGDLRENLIALRPDLVRAALTIMRAYVVAGRPKPRLPVFGRFEVWTQVVRAPLVWLGLQDPLDGVARLRNNDPVLSTLRSLLGPWQEAFADRPVSVIKAVSHARLYTDGELLEAFQELAGFGRDGIDTRAIGVFLRQHKGRVVDGLCFERGNDSHGVATWVVVEREGGMGGSPNPPHEESDSGDSSADARATGAHANAREGVGEIHPYPPDTGSDDGGPVWTDLGDGRGVL